MSKDKAKVRQLLDAVARVGPRLAHRARGQAGLRRLRHRACRARASPKSAAEAGKLASGMGFPVVMKIVSPDILHKTEAGGVIVGVKSADEATKAYDTILANAKKYKADAKIDGIQVQQMLKGGQEVIVGAVTDGSFGKLVAFGLGGVLVEVLKDITFRLAPATKADALSMLDGIQAAEMLKGVRGGDAVNRDALAEPDRRRQRAGQRLPGDLRDGPEPGLRDQGQARSPPTCASSSTSRRSRRATARPRPTSSRR